MKKLLPFALLPIALIAGGVSGEMLRPPPPVEDTTVENTEEVKAEADALDTEQVVTFDNNFIVPILRDGAVWSYVIVSLGIESRQTEADTIRLREPVLRDSLTEALFLHGSLGGFDGDFTEPLAMNRLRARLNEAASRRLSDETARVLIVSLARQSA